MTVRGGAPRRGSRSASRLRGVVALVAATALLVSTSCTTGPVLRGRIAGLEGVVQKAEQNGATRCAPRELALAKAHLRFAATDLDQGSAINAEGHLAIAEPNAQAAFALSPIEKCTTENLARDGDRDGDGISDSFDQCPDVRENYNGFEDLDGCPDDPDTDHDGIPDAKDKCPNQAEDPDGFEDEDGCPDDDNDKDTVADIYDECPNTPGQPNGVRPGCPSLIIVTAREIRITQQIQFDFNKSTIKPVSYPILDAVRDVLVANPKITIEVQGHTDNVGQAQYNLRLSGQRADAVRAYLVAHGIEPARLVSKGFGMNQPLVPNNTEGNRALNRRVQFIRTEAQPP